MLSIPGTLHQQECTDAPSALLCVDQGCLLARPSTPPRNAPTLVVLQDGAAVELAPDPPISVCTSGRGAVVCSETTATSYARAVPLSPYTTSSPLAMAEPVLRDVVCM